MFILLFLLPFVNSAKILVVTPSPCYSHALFSKFIYEELVRRGHEITAINHLKPERKVNNLTHITIQLSRNKEMNLHITSNVFTMNYQMQMKKLEICHQIYRNLHVQNLLRNEKFDLLIVEFNEVPCYSILKYHFNVPMIGVRSLGLRIEGHDNIGNPTNPSYILTAYNDKYEGFFGRLNESIKAIYFRLLHYFVIGPAAQRIVKKYFNFSGHVLDFEKEAELVLMDTNYILHGVRPLVPAAIEIGMLHLGRTKQVLPPEIKSFLEQNKNGTIYFTFGTLLCVEKEKLHIFIDAFKNLPYNVIWNHPHPIQNLPNNVKVLKWLPQEAILAHPNTKLFITHSGLHSVQEAIFHEVPMVNIPFLYDQPSIAKRVEVLGCGILLQYQMIDKVVLRNAIFQITNNSSYKSNIKKINRLLRDQPMPAMEKAMWWIEYVLKHKGAPYLRSKAVDMDWITYSLIDVALFLLFLFVISIYILKLLILKCFNSLVTKNKMD